MFFKSRVCWGGDSNNASQNKAEVLLVIIV